MRRLACCLAALLLATSAHAADTCAGPSDWNGDLTPITKTDWNRARAAHLIERAGFGETPEAIADLATRDPVALVNDLVSPQNVANGHLAPFDESGVFDEGLDPFPPSRPAATDLAKEKGEALGVKVKPAGNRRLQPVVNRFFYWLRASKLETQRVSYWWANRMLTTHRPLEEKMALFWHGHFATSEDKVRDYRKMLKQLQLFQTQGLGDFRELLISVAKDPAMLAYLDAGVNVKGAPNENFAREIMELFTMGVGNYQEADIREGARAFTGWNFKGTQFVINEDQHDATEKAFLGERGNFDGVQVIDIILKQPVTADFLASKIYKFFVRDDISPRNAQEARRCAALQRLSDRAAAQDHCFSRAISTRRPVAARTSRAPSNLSSRRTRSWGRAPYPASPISTRRPRHSDRRCSGRRRLLAGPMGVAGSRRACLSIAATSPAMSSSRISRSSRRTAIPAATIRSCRSAKRSRVASISRMPRRPDDKDMDMLATASMNVDRDEDFNTRFGSYRGWQMAIARVKPLPRHAAAIDLTKMIAESKTPLKTPADVVTLFVSRMFIVPPSPEAQQRLAAFLEKELGTNDIAAAQSYMEESLRMLMHLVLSQPEYQLG